MDEMESDVIDELVSEWNAMNATENHIQNTNKEDN